MGNLLAGIGGSDNSTSKKGIFEQPGGGFGRVILAGMIVGGGVLLYKMLPYLITLVDNAATLVLKLAYLAGLTILFGSIAYIFFDKKIRTRVGILYMMGIKAFTGIMIKIDPIAIIEDAIVKMKKKIAYMKENIGKMNGVKLDLKRKAQEKKALLQDCINRAKAARNLGKDSAAVIEERQAVRLENSVKLILDLYQSSEKWYNSLSKLCEMAELTVQDTQNEVDSKKEEYLMVKAAHKAFKSAMSAIEGDPDELAVYNQTLEFMRTDVMAKLGEMDRVLSQSGGYIDKLDVENEMYAVRGEDLLKKYDECGIEALFAQFETLPSGNKADPKKLTAHVPYETININGAVQPVSQKSKYFE
jgi:hypothetical protein